MTFPSHVQRPCELDDLVQHLARHTRLDPGEACRLVEEVLAYFAETPSEFVTRRHAELRRQGESNDAIYERIARELEGRRFAAPRLSQRQIRRLIYG
jgi:hypothetical protein